LGVEGLLLLEQDQFVLLEMGLAVGQLMDLVVHGLEVPRGRDGPGLHPLLDLVATLGRGGDVFLQLALPSGQLVHLGLHVPRRPVEAGPSLRQLGQGRPLGQAPVDLAAIAQDALADARAVAPQRQISLSSNGPVVVNGDDTRLRQVLGNLVRNALVHTPQSTPIEMAVSSEDSVGRISVADHGPGLAMQDLDRIFEPFYRADPSRSRDSGGSGLGLSIVNAVVAAHGGRVKVSETDGGGATFEVELPLAGGAAN